MTTRELPRHRTRACASIFEGFSSSGLLGALAIICLLFNNPLIEAGEQKLPGFEGPRDGTEERILDQQIISNLVENSSIVVVGEISSQSLADRYKMGLSTNTPFFVKITRVLVGDVPLDKAITVSIARDEYQFRFPKGEPFVFFLKKNLSPPTQPKDPVFGPGDWRTVADYFGIIPHTLTLERMVMRAARTPTQKPPKN